MFRTTHIRTKLAVALAVPMLALVAVAGFEVLDSKAEVDQAKAQADLAETSLGPGSLVVHLQNERNRAAIDLIGLGAAAELAVDNNPEARELTDPAAESFRQETDGHGGLVRERLRAGVGGLRGPRGPARRRRRLRRTDGQHERGVRRRGLRPLHGHHRGLLRRHLAGRLHRRRRRSPQRRRDRRRLHPSDRDAGAHRAQRRAGHHHRSSSTTPPSARRSPRWPTAARASMTRSSPTRPVRTPASATRPSPRPACRASTDRSSPTSPATAWRSLRC